MKQLIYGSTAAKHWFPEFREPNDLDIISKNHYWISAFEFLFENNKDSIYVEPNFLYTIKISHACYDINFDKTLKDIIFFQENNCCLNKQFYILLLEDWKKVHGNKRVNLNVKNEDFFTSKIERKYNHDYLHEQLCFYNTPLHEKIRKNLDSPLCSEELFNKLSEEDKIKCALEELYVFMFEREFLKLGEFKCFRHTKYKMLRHMIVSSTSGWFNLFLILNFKNILYYPDNIKDLEIKFNKVNI